MDLPKVVALVAAMNREKVDYVLFGALAMGMHGFVRATEDADFFIKPDADNIERLKRALRSVWDDPNIEQISTEELIGDYPAVTYYPEGEDFGIDFLTRLGEAFSFDSLAVEDGVFDGEPVRVVTVRTLYEMKRDTVRHKDKVDAELLRRKFFPEE